MAIYKNQSGTAKIFADVAGVTGGSGNVKFADSLDAYLTVPSGSSFSISEAKALYSGGVTKLFVTIQATSNTQLAPTTNIAVINSGAPDFLKPTNEGYARLGSVGTILLSNVWEPTTRSLTWDVVFNSTASTSWDRIAISKYGSDSIILTNGDYLSLEVVYYNASQASAAALSSLDDVDISSPQDNDLLAYSSSLDKFVNVHNEYVSKHQLQNIVYDSSDFADFKSRIASL